MKRYRIIEDNKGFYPQVRKFIFWYRIVEDSTGFSTYAYLYYPKTLEECERIILRYKEFLEKENKPKVVKYL